MAKLTKVYRTGPITTPVCNFDEYAAILATADTVRPAGHLARAQAVFASADILGNSRWLDALSDQVMNELTIDASNVYVYSVQAWDDACYGKAGESRDYKLSARAFGDYWASAIPLADFASVATERGLDTRKWEIMMPVDAVRATKAVSMARLKSALDPEHFQTTQILNKYKRIMRNHKFDQVRQAA